MACLAATTAASYASRLRLASTIAAGAGAWAGAAPGAVRAAAPSSSDRLGRCVRSSASKMARSAMR